MLRFFYLVRLTQQGLFHLISSSYPAIEPQAIIYLADKLVAGSMGGAISMSMNERSDARRATRKISINLCKELDEPVAEGFKTTYKDIMQVANCLGGERLYEQKKKEQNKNNHQPDAAQALATEVATTGIPPIWVVMPYSSMMDNSNFALPGNLPSLPFPSSLFIPSPNTNHKNENDKRNKKNKNNKDLKNVENDELEQQVDSKKENATNEIKNSGKQSVTTNQEENEAVVDNNENKDNISEYKDNDDEVKDTYNENKDNGEEIEIEIEKEEEEDDDDRFADAYSSDDDNELEDVQEEALASEKIENSNEEAPEEKKENMPTTEIDTENNTTTATSAPSTTEKDSVVPSPWQNFAASCHGDGDSNGSPLSPRSSSRSSPKFERK